MVAPLVGAAIVSGVSALAGSIANSVATKKQNERNEEARQKEVERVQQREDTAVSRGTRDAMSAGIDPRVNGSAPVQAGASPLEPQQYSAPKVGDLISQAGSDIGGMIMQQAQQDLQRNIMVSQLIEREYNNQFEENRQGFQRGLEQMTTIVNQQKETWSKERGSSVEFDEKIANTTQKITAKLSGTKVSIEEKERILKIARDINASKHNESKKDSDKVSVGGGTDVASSIIGAVDNLWGDINSKGETVTSGSQTGRPKSGVNPRSGESVNIPNPNDKKSSSTTRSNGSQHNEQKRTSDTKQKTKKGGLSAGYENVDEETIEDGTLHTTQDAKKNTDTTNEKGTDVYFTDEERSEVVKAYINEYSRKLNLTNKYGYNGIALADRVRFAHLYSSSYHQTAEFQRNLQSLGDYNSYFSKRFKHFRSTFDYDFGY